MRKQEAAKLGAALMASTLASAALAADGPARIVTHESPSAAIAVDASMAPTQVLPPGPTQAVLIVPREVVAPAAVVSRDVALQPTYDGLAVVQVNNITTLMDPYADYRRSDVPGGIDANHWILKAQRAYLGANSDDAARIITGAQHKEATTPIAEPDESYVIIQQDRPVLQVSAPTVQAAIGKASQAAPSAQPAPEPQAAPAPSAPPAESDPPDTETAMAKAANR